MTALAAAAPAPQAPRLIIQPATHARSHPHLISRHPHTEMLSARLAPPRLSLCPSSRTGGSSTRACVPSSCRNARRDHRVRQWRHAAPVERLIEQSLGKDERQTLFLGIGAPAAQATAGSRGRQQRLTFTNVPFEEHKIKRGVQRAPERRRSGTHGDVFRSSSFGCGHPSAQDVRRGTTTGTGPELDQPVPVPVPVWSPVPNSRVVKFCTVVRCCGLGCAMWTPARAPFCACAAREPPINTRGDTLS